MDIEQAKAIASDGLQGSSITHVEEYKNLFAVYFVNNEYLESGDFRDMAVGAGPRMIVKSTGEMFETGSGKTGNFYAKAYEAGGSVYARPINSITIYAVPEFFDKPKAILSVKKICEISLIEARSTINRVIDTGRARLDFSQCSDISWKLNKLNEMGFTVKQLWGR